MPQNVLKHTDTLALSPSLSLSHTHTHAHTHTHIHTHTHTRSVPEPIHQALIAGPCQPPAPGLQASSQGLELRAPGQSVMVLGHGPAFHHP